MDYMTLGSTPVDEECAQVGSDGYCEKAMAESNAFIRQLRRLFPDIPANTRFKVQSFSHDFGTYHEVTVIFNEKDKESVEFAINVENNLPEKWDTKAREELGLS